MYRPGARFTLKVASDCAEVSEVPGAIPIGMLTPAGTSKNSVAVRNARSLTRRLVPAHTSTTDAPGSAALWMIWTSAIGGVGTLGNAMKAPPVGATANNPNAGPPPLAAGSRKPEATTTMAAPPRAETSARNVAIGTPPVGAIPKS